MTTTFKSIWQSTLEALSEKVGDSRFNLWFKNTELADVTDKVATLGVPSLFVRDWLDDHYRSVLEEVLASELGERVRIVFRVEPKLFQASRRREAETKSQVLDELSRPPAQPLAQAPDAALRPEFRLDNFVVGPCNRLAHAAARQVAESANSSFNPLFIHGSVGLGKTHILQGVCNYVNEHFPNRRAYYSSAEGFTNQFVAALRHRSLDAFRYKFRNVDLLAIDDVHFLASKAATQDEFLHTFDYLDLSQKQILMASDAHPKQIKAMKEALVSRCVAGMLVALERPDLETRLAIVRQKAQERSPHLNDEEALLYIAQHATDSVRELEGAVNIVAASMALARRKADVNFVREVLANTAGARRRQPTAQEILCAVAEHCGVEVKAFSGRSRARAISQPRHVAMYLVRELTHMSYQEIARLFGRREHSTVIFACRKISRALTEDSSLRKTVEDIGRKLRAPRTD